MKKFKSLFLFLAGLFLANQGMYADKTDPNHLATGGYGYLITQNSDQTLWWAEGSYKVMKDAPVPKLERKTIALESARNEWESFILVSRPSKDLEKVNVKLSEMTSKKYTIPASAFTVRSVEYVNVTHPTDYYGFVGEWPDPLPLNRADRTLKAGENNSFWISIKTPKEAEPGKYEGHVTLSGEGWSEEVPVLLEVWDFALPDSPTLRSAFGFDMYVVSKYNNLTTNAQKQKAFDIHMKAFSDYKISPYNPFYMTPIKETVTGVDWSGGLYDSNEKHSGKYSYMVADNSYTSNSEAHVRELVPVAGDKNYHLDWWAKAKDDNQKYVVGVECFDQNDRLLYFENRYEEFTAGKEWKSFTYDLGHFLPEISKVKIHLYPSRRVSDGTTLGTMWFDDIALFDAGQKENLLACGNFEVDVDKIDVKLDFTDYNKAAKKYFGEYGFNSFQCMLKGIGGGTYFSRSGGVFEGFAQGTEEYNRLMQRYLKQIENNLEKTGLLGKEYIYWFDEPGPDDYKFVHSTNAMLKKYAPKMSTFLTEHLAGFDISDVTDISCCVFNQFNKEKAEKIYKNGKACWSYLCCGPKSPWITEFIDHDAVNMRMWVWATYQLGMSGVLIWSSTYWNSPEASPLGILQNPWDEAMSWVTGYGSVLGKQSMWGNGDGRLFYPENRNVNTDHNVYNNEAVPSVRLEILRDGIEDYEYFKMIEKLTKNAKGRKAAKAKELLRIPSAIYQDGTHYSKNPKDMLEYRKELAKAIMSLQ